MADVPSDMIDHLDQHPFRADLHETAVIDHKAFCVNWNSRAIKRCYRARYVFIAEITWSASDVPLASLWQVPRHGTKMHWDVGNRELGSFASHNLTPMS